MGWIKGQEGASGETDPFAANTPAEDVMESAPGADAEESDPSDEPASAPTPTAPTPAEAALDINSSAYGLQRKHE